MIKLWRALALATVILWSWPADAAVLYVEGADLSNSLATPTVLGPLTIGSNTVNGAVAGPFDADNAQFVVPVGHLLDKLLLVSCVSACFSTNVGIKIAVRNVSDAVLFLLDLRPPSVSPPLPLDVLDGNSLAPGTYKLTIDDSSSFASAGNRPYGLDLQLAAVPIPAALPLLFSGLFALGAMGWRRRKKLLGDSASPAVAFN